MKDENKDSWPDFFPPELELPPEDAVDAEGTVYRFVKSIPPTETCFLATHQEQPHRHERCETLEKNKRYTELVYGPAKNYYWKR